MKKFSIENILCIIFGIIGVVFLTVALQVMYLGGIPKENRVKTTATIINDDYNKVLVSYFVNGFPYSNYLSETSSYYYIGKEITIYYDKNNPNNIMSNSIFIISYVFGGIAILFIGIAGGIHYFQIRKKKLIIRLKETGNIVNAKYKEIKKNYNYEVNGRNPYNIFCEWQGMDGKVHLFKSENIWFDPTQIINDHGIKTFQVYINPNNYKEYYVNITMISENNYR